MVDRFLTLYFVITISLVQLACPGILSPKPGEREYREITRNDSADNTQLIMRFNEYPIEKRIDIFLYSDDPRLTPILAKTGSDAIPAIVGRMERKEVHIWDKVRLLGVVLDINRTCQCVSTNRQMMARLEAVSQSLEDTRFVDADDPRKESFRQSLDVLKER